MTSSVTHLWRLLKWGRTLARHGALTGIEQDPMTPPQVRRLARIARAKTYGETVAWMGPTLKSATRTKDGLRLTFDHAEGLTLRGPGSFEIAGSDGTFPAFGRLEESAKRADTSGAKLLTSLGQDVSDTERAKAEAKGELPREALPVLTATRFGKGPPHRRCAPRTTRVSHGSAPAIPGVIRRLTRDVPMPTRARSSAADRRLRKYRAKHSSAVGNSKACSWWIPAARGYASSDPHASTMAGWRSAPAYPATNGSR